MPWLCLIQELGFEIRIARVDDRGDIRLDDYARLLHGPVKFVDFTQVSNALGSVTPDKAVIEMAHAAGAVVVLDAMPPWQGGGNMIEDVTFEHIRYHAAPMKFEAGTGNLVDAVGRGGALDYVESIGREAICAHEYSLIAYTKMQLRQIPGVKLIGEPTAREGHHCAQPILRRMGVEATVRPYNTLGDVDALCC